MSDFGLLMSVVKKDGGTFSAEELTSIGNAMESIISAEEYANTLGEPFLHEFSSSNEPEAVAQLSEYYFGDEEPEESMEFVEENELDEAKELATKMGERFSEMTFTATLEEW